jgi:hypothetical protein
MHINIYCLLDFLKEKLKIVNEGNRKTNFIFWKFKDQKNEKIGTKHQIFKKNIRK